MQFLQAGSQGRLPRRSGVVHLLISRVFVKKVSVQGLGAVSETQQETK